VTWAFVGLLAAALLAGLAWRTRSRRGRLALVYLACVPLVLGAFELHLGLRTRPEFDAEMPPAWRVRDDEVGVRPAPGVAYREALRLGSEPIYDVVYTIDERGERVTPPVRGDGDALCVLFFGCSFTFGTGVGDEDTLPWLTGVASGQRHRIHNFSFGGWGPHQMLAALQSGQVDSALDCEPTHAIYQSVHDHVRRVAGRSPWDPHGPRFVLDASGRPVRAGNFDDRPSFPRSWPLLRNSEILRILAEDFEPGPRDYELFAEVVKASRDLLASRHPGVEFHVLLWDKRWKQDPEYWEGLERRGLRVHFVSGLLPDLREAPERWAVSPHDGHPNRAANERIAGFVAREILGEAPRPTGAPAPASASAPSRAAAP
jgi:hypothetical protein